MSAALISSTSDFKFTASNVSVKTVEIDESWFGKKRKYNRGTGRQTTLVFGIVEKGGPRCFFRLVPTNSREQLIPIIKQFIGTDCKINHDGLATYACLHDEGYEHAEVNHSVEFVTDEGVHTNTIEGLWGLVKQRISYMHGLPSLESLAAHLDEYSYRSFFLRRNMKENFDVFLRHVVQYVNPPAATSAATADCEEGCSTESHVPPSPAQSCESEF